MTLTSSIFFDVIIIGSGIAGLSAAVEASEHGCSSALISSTHLFSGSSFYPGTWGFGLVGPADEADTEELIDTICAVGADIPDKQLVRSFVSGITPAIQRLKSLGCIPKKASQNGEREFIPCFDHKHRNWNGLEAHSLKECFTNRIAQNQITVLEECTLLDIVKDSERVIGIVVANKGRLELLGCSSLILATGGYGDLFKYHLCPSDVNGSCHCLALKAGCQLTNMEFMQMMLGFLSPACNTIFNEKTYRFAHFQTSDGRELFDDKDSFFLDLRAMHGPFTSRLPSKIVDQKIHKEFLKSGHGIIVSYNRRDNLPEFVNIYFEWLKAAKGVSVDDSIEAAIFAHAANGGIKIDCEGWTGVPGLFACGEVTGGMHGADRIGGLSTANGLVFGQRSGIAAAAFALRMRQSEHESIEYDYRPRIFKDTSNIKHHIQNAMYENALVFRNEEGLKRTIEEFSTYQNSGKCDDYANFEDIVMSRSVECQLTTALCILKSALLRTESRGSHFREDYPGTNSRLAFPICVRLEGERIVAYFTE